MAAEDMSAGSGQVGAPNRLEPGLSREAQERLAAFERAARRRAGVEPPGCDGEAGMGPTDRYRLLAENVRDYAIFLLDVEGRIVCWGEGARLLKRWTREQAEGAHLRLLYPDGGAEDGTAEAHLQAARDSGEYTGEGHRLRSDGSTFWAYVTLTALRGPDGTLHGFAKVTRDFSARRAVEAALQRERQQVPIPQVDSETTRLKRVVANLSHELRTPLNAVVGSIALLHEQVREGGLDRRHVDRLERSSRHLLTMVDDLLQLSRADAGEVRLSPAERRLGPAVQEALADVETLALQRGHVIVNAVSGTAADLPYWGDEERVRQILVNLLVNAIKFTDADGRITISGGTALEVPTARLRGPGPWLFVRVEDTGRGIPPERLESIFEPFTQGQPSDGQQGSGLGLAISRQLARLMGGDLTAESTPDSGSAFTLWLPITIAEPIPR